MSACRFVCLCVCMYAYRLVWLRACLLVCLSVCLSTFWLVYLCACMPVSLSICLSVGLSVCMSGSPRACLPECQSCLFPISRLFSIRLADRQSFFRFFCNTSLAFSMQPGLRRRAECRLLRQLLRFQHSLRNAEGELSFRAGENKLIFYSDSHRVYRIKFARKRTGPPSRPSRRTR